MIKVEQTHDCKSYWRQDGLYDFKRDKTKKIKLFGITIWQDKESYNCDLVDSKNGLGFKI